MLFSVHAQEQSDTNRVLEENRTGQPHQTCIISTLLQCLIQVAFPVEKQIFTFCHAMFNASFFF